MPSNPFAALDFDSEDEQPPAVSSHNKTKKKAPVSEGQRQRAGRGNGGRTSKGKRVFDRRSGTGRGKEIKKAGGGSHNWGSHQDEIQHYNDSNNNNDTTTHPYDDDDQRTTTKEEEKEPPVVVNNTIAFDDYMANVQTKSGVLAPVQERSVDNDEFANLLKAAKENNRQQQQPSSNNNNNKAKKEKKNNHVNLAATDLLAGMRVGRGGGGRSGRGGRERSGRGSRGGEGRSRGGGDGRSRGKNGGRSDNKGGRGDNKGGRKGSSRGGGGRGREDKGRSGGRGKAMKPLLDPASFPAL